MTTSAGLAFATTADQLDLLVADVRITNGSAEELALALAEDVVPDRAAAVARVREVLVDEPLVVPEVQVGLRPILGDEHLAVLERAHRARSTFRYGSNFCACAEAARLEQTTEEGGDDPFRGADDPARDEDVAGRRPLAHGAARAGPARRRPGVASIRSPSERRSPRRVTAASARSRSTSKARQPPHGLKPSTAPRAFDPASPSMVISRRSRERAGQPRRALARPAARRALRRPITNAFTALPGRVSSWFRRFAESPVEHRRRRRPPCATNLAREVDQAERAGRSAGAEMRAEPGRSRDRPRARSPRPARPRAQRGRRCFRRAKPQARKFRTCGARLARTRSRSWRPRWKNPAASRPVARCSVEAPPPGRRDRPAARRSSSCLDAEARRDGKHRRRAASDAHEAEGAPACGARPAKLDQDACDALREPEPAARGAQDGPDRHVRTGPDERAEIAVGVGVAEQRPGGAPALGQGERLPLPRRRGRTTLAPAASAAAAVRSRGRRRRRRPRRRGTPLATRRPRGRSVPPRRAPRRGQSVPAHSSAAAVAAEDQRARRRSRRLDPVAPWTRTGRQERERRNLAGRAVDPVDRRKAPSVMEGPESRSGVRRSSRPRRSARTAARPL